MASKLASVGETNSKLIINKWLAKQYLDTEDYDKLMEIVSILKTCDKLVKDTLTV